MDMLTPSKKDDYPFLADWFAISLRWLVLLGITNSLLLAGKVNWTVIYVLFVGALWNVFSSILAMLNQRIPAHRLIHVLMDAVLTCLIFFFSGGVGGPLPWVSLMTLFSAAIYYEWRGGLLLAILISIAQAALGSLFFQTNPPYLNYLLILIVFNIALGLAFGLLSRQVMGSIRHHYFGLLGKRMDDERRAQRRERDQMRAVFNMIETLSSSLNYQTVIETALDISAEAVGVSPKNDETLVRAALLFGERDLQVQVGRGLSLDELHQTFPAKEGVLKEVLNSAKPKILSSPYQDEELKRLPCLENCSHVLLLPLNRGLNAYGMMLFAHPDEHFFTADRCEILEVLSHQAVVAIQNARLFQDIAEEKERIVATQEEERKKLARELHDGPTQSVSAIAMNIAIARRLLDTNILEAGAELERVEELARRTTQEMRTMLFTLRPLVLESDGLIPALQTMADKMSDTYHQNIILEIDPEVVIMLELNKQNILFYLVEEAVNNARKHAKASEIKVKLHFVTKNNNLGLLEVSDNGIGFNLDEINKTYERRGSLGMVNLRERAELVNGKLHIDSAPGQGTCVQVAIPFTKEAEERLQSGLTNRINMFK